MEEKWEDLGEMRSLEGGFKSAALPPHTLRESHTHSERDTLALCSHSSEVICAAGLCASA